MTTRDNSAVFPKEMLDAEYQNKFLCPWLFESEDGILEFETEKDACAAQRAYRGRKGYNPITGEET